MRPCRYRVMMIPCKLLIRFVCWMDIVIGMLSPGKHPALRSSILAVIVLLGTALFDVVSGVLLTGFEGAVCPITYPVLLLLTALSSLISLCKSLGSGLIGEPGGLIIDGRWLTVSSDAGDSVVFGCRLLFSASAANWSAFAADRLCFLECFAIGSSEIMRGFGRLIGPMSTVSTKDILRSHVNVAAIDVGRVRVERIIYEIVPLSNCGAVSISLVMRSAFTYIDA